MPISQDTIVTVLIRNRSRFIGYAWVVVGNPQLAEDIIQDVTLAAIKKADEIQDEHFEEVFPEIHNRDEAYEKDKEATVVKLSDVSSLSITEANCGQYTGTTAAPFRIREPFVARGAAPKADDGTPKTKAPPSGPLVKGLAVTSFYQANCAVCHGAKRQGGVGLPLLPARLTQPDEFYVDTIANGRPGTAMPAWRQTAQLTDEDIQNLVTFIKTTIP